jgi:translation initiation factor eIF-2B subunit alpha/methylthioribose-1-phosphate isomerase
MKIEGRHYRTVWFSDGELHLINQNLLPSRFEIVRYRRYREAAEAIRCMVVRGAPAIGSAGAFAMALAQAEGAEIQEAAEVLRATRPTAQDLSFGIQRVLDGTARGLSALAAAQEVADDYEASCRAIGRHGEHLIEDGVRLSTHCNAGWLATVDWGTATAPMYMARRRGRDFFVWVDETRPRCQGSRLTAYELGQEGIRHAVIADSAAGALMARGEIDLVLVGSDRIAMNGDVANKIGTYSSAVLAKENGIPFYVAAPTATVDSGSATGADIPIEERDPDEVACAVGWDEERRREARVRIAPEGTLARNIAFDVTPARYVTGILTEKGIFEAHRIGEALAR